MQWALGTPFMYFWSSVSPVWDTACQGTFYQTQIYYPDLLSRLYGITGQLALYEDGGIADQETRVVPLLVALPSTCMGNVNKSLMSLGVLNNQVLGLENDLAKNTVA